MNKNRSSISIVCRVTKNYTELRAVGEELFEINRIIKPLSAFKESSWQKQEQKIV